ncbi:MAG: hypothetical protein E7207_08020 [Clostridium butyricum]|nr:hypothetical protein [Clostridium butyricum]
MEDKKTDMNKEENSSLTVNLSAGTDKIKYYECENDNCIFEISDNDNNCNNEVENFNESGNENNNTDGEAEVLEDKKDYDTEEENEEFKYGRIIVKSIIDYGKREVLSGVKINLYKINGLSPVLIKSGVTNKQGEVIFKNIFEGSYRIIEIVDKRYFEKPKYVKWNEITISQSNKQERILVINKIKNCKS